ncbi:MAG: hypothetical protein FWE54_05195 [Methanimicrococcus sp.]|nr:hypothetical protein [Methanimicrococcus sp.]
MPRRNLNDKGQINTAREDEDKRKLAVLITDFAVLSELADKYDALKKEKEKEIIAIMKEHRLLKYETGAGVVEYRVPGVRTIINGDLLKAEAPDLFLAYAKDIPVVEKAVLKKTVEK